MADHGVMLAVARRYGIRMFVWNAPALEALESLGNRQRTFRYYDLSPPGLPNRPHTLYLLHTNLNCEHFEPIVPVQGTTARPCRFSQVGNQVEAEGWCPILNLRYTSNAAHNRVRKNWYMFLSACMV
jgi:hypothetical protein